jgi:hypothetical protein
MKLSEHDVTLAADQAEDLGVTITPENSPLVIAHVTPADPGLAAEVLAADVDDRDGRSGWMWVRLANGDLIS